MVTRSGNVRAVRSALLPLVIFVAACPSADDATPPVPAPQVSMAGYVELGFDLSALDVAPADVTGVKAGGVRAYRLRAVGDTLFATIQGSPTPGLADVELWTAPSDGGPTGPFGASPAATLPDAVEFLPPADPAFSTVVALGASLGQGVQDAVPTQESIAQSPVLMVAQQLGAYFPVPMFRDPLLTPMSPEILGPPPECTKPSVVGYVAEGAIGVLANLQDEDGDIAYWPARVDPLLPVHNVSVGGTTISDTVFGPEPGNFGVNFLGHLVNEPFGAVGSQLAFPQVELVADLEPTVVLSTDLFGNDLIISIADSEGPETDLETLTSVEDFEVALAGFVDAMEPLGAEVFVATIPYPSALPAADLKDPADVAVVDARTEEFNARLRTAGEAHDWLHVVDLFARVESMDEDPVRVAGQPLPLTRFGGLLGIDSVHFSETGYALVANLFIDEINAVFGTDVPPVPLAPLWARDAANPANLRAAGFDPSACIPPEQR